MPTKTEWRRIQNATQPDRPRAPGAADQQRIIQQHITRLADTTDGRGELKSTFDARESFLDDVRSGEIEAFSSSLCSWYKRLLRRSSDELITGIRGNSTGYFQRRAQRELATVKSYEETFHPDLIRDEMESAGSAVDEDVSRVGLDCDDKSLVTLPQENQEEPARGAAAFARKPAKSDRRLLDRIPIGRHAA